MTKSSKIALILTAVAGLSACAAPEVVSERKAGDTALTCAQLGAQLREAEKFKEKARAEKGVTGTNVAAGLFFWPALLVTYSNSEEAIEAAEDRQEHLYKIADSKNCKV
ncbi:hypothetical protein [Roseovarius nanhaiticus]|uniref:hypothetical protein n=1 Tax=Roseovarius nanhaiticus TaxID=573024 RepID=UPI0024900B86|nr:hypothetical protein [Roseovarius nanhaiticus]